MQGTISASISQLASLQTLILNGNNFGGTFPNINLPRLSSFDISDNNFAGVYSF